MTRVPAILLIAGLLVMGAKPAQAQFEDVGSFEFPTSASAEAQNHFLRGQPFCTASVGYRPVRNSMRLRRSTRTSRWRTGASPSRTSTP